MIEIDLKKLERGLRSGTVTVRRGGKIFQRKQRLGQKEKEEKEEDDKLMSSKSDFFPNVGDTVSINGDKRTLVAVNKRANSVRTVGGGWHDWGDCELISTGEKTKPISTPKPGEFPKVGDTIIVSGKEREVSWVNEKQKSIGIVGMKSGISWFPGKISNKPKPKPKSKPELKPVPVHEFPNTKEYKTTIDRATKRFDKILDDSPGKTFIGKIWEFIGHTKGVETLNPKWGKDTQILRDDLDKLNNLLDDNYDVDVDIEALSWGERSYEQGGKTIHINVNSESRDRFLFHEIGHIIEDQGKNSDVAAWFMQERTKGETPCKLSDLLPRAGYGDDEITRKDHFIDPYIGKMYYRESLTEVISMGLERFVDGDLAKNFYYRDPEHFMFLLAIMSGEFIEGAKK